MFSAPALSVRLKALYELPASHQYDAVWDLCCDHGHLGLALLASGRAEHVHFVDQVPSIMANLGRQVAALPGRSRARVSLHTKPAEALVPPVLTSQLLVLAGVGGDKTLGILQALVKQPNLDHAHWLLSPANDVFAVRQWLRGQGFSLLAEETVTEQTRCYELLWVCRLADAARPVPVVGDVWQPEDPAHARYLHRLRRHYTNRLRSPNVGVVTGARTALEAHADLFAQLDPGPV